MYQVDSRLSFSTSVLQMSTRRQKSAHSLLLAQFSI